MRKLAWDFNLKGFSEHTVHLVDLCRQELLEFGAAPMSRLKHSGGLVRTAGLVVARQKPPTAKGFAFWLLEDNLEMMQVVISPDLWMANRGMLNDSCILLAEGSLRQEGRAWTLTAGQLWGTAGSWTKEGVRFFLWE